MYKSRNNLSKLPYLLSNLPIPDGAKVVVLVAKSLFVLGGYRYDANLHELILEKEIKKNIKEFYDKLPMITFVNERTYKLFAKRLRQIEERDYLAFLR